MSSNKRLSLAQLLIWVSRGRFDRVSNFSLASSNTEEEAAAAMARFFDTQFSGAVSYDPTEYINDGASSNLNSNRGRKRKEQPGLFSRAAEFLCPV